MGRIELPKGDSAASRYHSIEPSWLCLLNAREREREDLNIFNLTLSIYGTFCVKVSYNVLTIAPPGFLV